MGLKVAIVGLWSETHDLAPWDDPQWEKWGLAWDAKSVFNFDRVFEMHVASEWKNYAPKDYIQRLNMVPRLYLQEPHAELPKGECFPEEVVQTTGDYFSSSLAYLMALAIHEGAEEIGLYGVAMEANDEYATQRPNMEYLVGLARGRGIKVYIPDQSPLCKFALQTGYTKRYGRFD